MGIAAIAGFVILGVAVGLGLLLAIRARAAEDRALAARGVAWLRPDGIGPEPAPTLEPK